MCTVWWNMKSDVAKYLRFPSPLNFLEFMGSYLPYPGLHVFLFRWLPDNSETRGLSLATSFAVHTSIWASFCYPWELDAASGLEVCFDLTSSFPEHPICWLEGFLETMIVRLIFVVLSSCCSCIRFAVLVQIKLKFLALQRKLKWLMLHK